MVPIRWVLFKAFRKNAEGLAGFRRNQLRGFEKMNNKMMIAKCARTAMLAGGLFLILAAVGCSSDTPTGGELLSPATRDYAAPAAPTGLSAAVVGSLVKVAWLPNTTDEDLAGYMLYRVAFGQAWPLFDSPNQQTSYLDTSPLRRPCHYRVVAIDEQGNESTWLEIPFQGVANLPEFHR